MIAKKSVHHHMSPYHVNLTIAVETINRTLRHTAWTTETSNIDAWNRFATQTDRIRDCDDFIQWGFVAFVENVAGKLAEMQQGRVADCVKLCASKIKPLARKIEGEDIDERVRSYVDTWSAPLDIKPLQCASTQLAVGKVECKDDAIAAIAKQSADTSATTAVDPKDASNHGTREDGYGACSDQGRLDYLDDWVDDIDDEREEHARYYACKKARRTAQRVMLCPQFPGGISDELAGTRGEISGCSNDGDITVILDDAPHGVGIDQVTLPKTMVVPCLLEDTEALVTVYANDERGGCIRLVIDRNATIALLALAVRKSNMGTVRGWNTVHMSSCEGGLFRRISGSSIRH